MCKKRKNLVVWVVLLGGGMYVYTLTAKQRVVVVKTMCILLIIAAPCLLLWQLLIVWAVSNSVLLVKDPRLTCVFFLEKMIFNDCDTKIKDAC